jgi:hypothetical protein
MWAATRCAAIARRDKNALIHNFWKPLLAFPIFVEAKVKIYKSLTLNGF